MASEYKDTDYPVVQNGKHKGVIGVGGLLLARIPNEIADKLLGGLVLEYGWSRDRTCYKAIPAYGMPESHVDDATRQFLVRPGITWEYMKDGMVYLDYEFGTFWNDTGTLNVHRVYAGVEQGVFEFIFPRVGVTVDPGIGRCSWTTGVGFYPAKWMSVDVAYQYNMFPEITEDFGRSHTFNISVSITF